MKVVGVWITRGSAATNGNVCVIRAIHFFPFTSAAIATLAALSGESAGGSSKTVTKRSSWSPSDNAANAGGYFLAGDALNLPALDFLQAAGDLGLPREFGFRVADVQVFRQTSYQFADLLRRPVAGSPRNLEGNETGTFHSGRSTFMASKSFRRFPQSPPWHDCKGGNKIIEDSEVSSKRFPLKPYCAAKRTQHKRMGEGSGHF